MRRLQNHTPTFSTHQTNISSFILVRVIGIQKAEHIFIDNSPSTDSPTRGEQLYKGLMSYKRKIG
jgi:hypothetical protein